MEKQKKRLWIVPHQDDEVLSMGMGIIKSSREGFQNYILQVTDGGSSAIRRVLNGEMKCHCITCPRKVNEKGHNPVEENYLDKLLDRKEFVAARNREMDLALSIMKAAIYKRLNYPDGALNNLLKEKIKNEIIVWIEMNGGKSAIEAGYIQLRVTSELDDHPDHIFCANVVKGLIKEYNSEILEENSEFYLNPYCRNVKYEIIDNDEYKDIYVQALKSYCQYRPLDGFYAIGLHSVEEVFAERLNNAVSKYHLYIGDERELK